jgi:hypothetical protein
LLPDGDLHPGNPNIQRLHDQKTNKQLKFSCAHAYVAGWHRQAAEHPGPAAAFWAVSRCQQAMARTQYTQSQSRTIKTVNISGARPQPVEQIPNMYGLLSMCHVLSCLRHLPCQGRQVGRNRQIASALCSSTRSLSLQPYTRPGMTSLHSVTRLQ